LNVLPAEGLNLGLSKMAGAKNTHHYFQLSRLSRWHVESEAMARALAIVIEAQSALPMAKFWGAGQTASSDGQFFPADGLLMTDAGQKIREQYADTGGFTDHVFAVTAMLGFQFIPRIRDLPSKRLYLFDPASCPKELKGRKHSAGDAVTRP